VTIFILRWAFTSVCAYLQWLLWQWANTKGALIPMLVLLSLVSTAIVLIQEQRQERKSFIEMLRR
jgi:hypothetical protein